MPHGGGSGSINHSGDVDEGQPLLGSGRKPARADRRIPDSTVPSGSDTNLKIILPCLMLCVFLAAFDVTVVAAIYSVMSLDVSVCRTDCQRIRFQ